MVVTSSSVLWDVTRFGGLYHFQLQSSMQSFFPVLATDPYGRILDILDFLDRSRCFFFQVASQL
jgi:hypothetical protein